MSTTQEQITQEPLSIGRIEMPPVVAPLQDPHRYYVLYGGRNGVKSWSIARHLLARGIEEPLRFLCCRETMITIKDSVHALLELQIKTLGLEAYYDVQKSAIYGMNGTLFSYAGLRGLKNDKTALKSYESFDAAWVEEAENVSKESWATLIPTMRKAGSRIYVSFNPHLATDNTYVRFIKQTPPDCVLIPTNYRDNPWLSDEAWADMMHLKETDPDEFDHIYEGECVRQVKGAVYGKELAAVEKSGRICKVEKDPYTPVHTFWDVGDRHTSIWLAQRMPMQVRVLGYISGENLGLSDYVEELQEKKHIYGTHYLPWETGNSNQLGTGMTIAKQLRGYGFKVEVLQRRSMKDQLNAGREMFPLMWFDDEGCEDGLNGLRHYRWPPEGSEGQLSNEPLHDWASHPGSAYNYMALAITNEDPKEKKGQRTRKREKKNPWV